ncbi:MAG: AAA family ATPase [Candidatus Aenigmarchaeota archaeon]|nr:AAA family ATPase [Candidatus Aenigmarchaeota archaeon]
MQYLEESKIFKNEEILSPEYLPEMLPHREQQIKLLANNLLPASKGRKPQNTFIHGAPGIGKTACTKYVFREFESYSERVKTIYLNCWDYRSSHAILTKIVLDCGGFVPRRGTSKDEILEKFLEIARTLNKGFVICLDEVDKLIPEGQDALYDLLRMNQYLKNPFGIVFISNNPYVFAGVDGRIRSSLAIEEIGFNTYNLSEMVGILDERAKQAFFKVEKGVVLLAANRAIKKGGDVRVGLECLLRAGRVAEAENANEVKVKYVRKVLRGVKEVKPQILKERINNTEKVILDILEERKRLTSNELYQACKKKVSEISDRTIRNYLRELAKIGLIKVRRVRGIRGFSRIISKV